MPSKANVKIEYGPYKSNGIADYKEDRLVGLKSMNQIKIIIITPIKLQLKKTVIVN